MPRPEQSDTLEQVGIILQSRPEDKTKICYSEQFPLTYLTSNLFLLGQLHPRTNQFCTRCIGVNPVEAKLLNFTETKA